ncbi:PAS domain S-box [Burkholderiales bacterium JOSHI_001]|nr:PAS domain S-box [Burkholderiales bacterium JOSHI_001]
MTPSAATGRVLVVEDTESDFLLLQAHLRSRGWAAPCHRVSNADELQAALQQTDWQVVLADYRLPGLSFEAMLQQVHDKLPDLPVILVSGTVGEESAVDLLRSGVADFVLKDRLARLVPAIERSLAELQRRRDAAAAARAQAESEAWSHALLQTLADGLFVAQDGQLVFVNPALAQTLDCSPGELGGRHLDSLVVPEHRALWSSQVQHWMQLQASDEASPRLEVQLRLHDDAPARWVEIAAARFRFRDRAALLGVVRDVDERHRHLAELLQYRQHLETLVVERTRKAEEASRVKSAFLANMSHEIRTPLQTVLGLTGLMQREPLAPPQARRMTQIDAAARHLLQVLDSILDLSKIEADQLKLELQDFELGALLEQVRALVAEQARAKGLVLRVEALDTALWLRGDPTRLRQALLNYASNAVKFTEAGGVRLRAVPLDETLQPMVLRFEVQDTGPGIPSQDLPRLFDAFEQADSSTTRRHGGTGLGLAITRRLAQLMGGEAGARSQPGQGSVFWFTARLERGRPLSDAEQNDEPDAAAVEAQLRQRHAGARVLLAEDHAVNREVAVALLNSVGLQVDCAHNGHEALALAAQRPYELVLMDMQMPGLDGLAATRALRELPNGPGLPILALTANAFADDREACRAAGMDGFIAKPVRPARLFSQLLHWLDAADASRSVHAPQGTPLPDPAPPPVDIAAAPDTDFSRALQRLRGDQAAMDRIRRVFARTHAGDALRLRELLAQDRGPELAELLHTLKSSAAAVGGQAVATEAGDLERALKSGLALPRLAPRMQALADKLDELLAVVRA